VVEEELLELRWFGKVCRFLRGVEVVEEVEEEHMGQPYKVVAEVVVVVEEEVGNMVDKVEAEGVVALEVVPDMAEHIQQLVVGLGALEVADNLDPAHILDAHSIFLF